MERIYKIESEKDVLICKDLDVEWMKVMANAMALHSDSEYLSGQLSLMSINGVRADRIYGLGLIIGTTTDYLYQSLFGFYKYYYCEIFYDMTSQIAEEKEKIDKTIDSISSRLNQILGGVDAINDEVFTNDMITDIYQYAIGELEMCRLLLSSLLIINKTRTSHECLIIHDANEDYFKRNIITNKSVDRYIDYLMNDSIRYYEEDEKRKFRIKNYQDVVTSFHGNEAGKFWVENRDQLEYAAYAIAALPLDKKAKSEYFSQIMCIEKIEEILDNECGDKQNFPYCYSRDNLSIVYEFLVEENFISKSTKLDHFLYYFGSSGYKPSGLKKIMYTMKEAPKQLLRDFIMRLYDEQIKKKNVTKAELEKIVPNVFCSTDGKDYCLAKQKVVYSNFLDKLDEIIGKIAT